MASTGCKCRLLVISHLNLLSYMRSGFRPFDLLQDAFAAWVEPKLTRGVNITQPIFTEGKIIEHKGAPFCVGSSVDKIMQLIVVSFRTFTVRNSIT